MRISVVGWTRDEKLVLSADMKRERLSHLVGTATKRFQRTREDFVCARCGALIRGDGYTNHCPDCLWSRHVDVHPGDRREACRGLMEPVGVKSGGGEYSILHRCVACGFERRNAASESDNVDELIRISALTS